MIDNRDMRSAKMGLEVEFHRVSTCALESVTWFQWSVHDDGSTREATYRLACDDGSFIALSPQVIARNGRDNIIVPSGVVAGENIGLEMVTTPYPYPVMRQHMERLSSFLAVVPQTPRTSIHIHVDINRVPWVDVRNVLLWAYHLEAVLYRLACGGMVHRGERMFRGKPTDHMFARPLSQPIGVNYGRSERAEPLIKWGEMMNARTSSEFVSAWGRADMYFSRHLDLPHYIAHRLHMINLVSALRYGTLEWRLFDALYDRIELLCDVVAAVHRLGYSGAVPPFEPMLIGQKPDINEREVSDILQVDIAYLWGKRWPNPIVTQNLYSHYGGRFVAPSFNQTPLFTIDHDDGSRTAPLVIRRG